MKSLYIKTHLRASTFRERTREVAIFLDFMGSSNGAAPNQMRPTNILAFVTSRDRLRPKTVSRIVSDVRGFLQFLLL